MHIGESPNLTAGERLILAGEITPVEHYSAVHGVHFSGVAAAAKILSG